MPSSRHQVGFSLASWRWSHAPQDQQRADWCAPDRWRLQVSSTAERQGWLAIVAGGLGPARTAPAGPRSTLAAAQGREPGRQPREVGRNHGRERENVGVNYVRGGAPAGELWGPVVLGPGLIHSAAPYRRGAGLPGAGARPAPPAWLSQQRGTADVEENQGSLISLLRSMEPTQPEEASSDQLGG